METMERNEYTPLYLWIKECGSILNIRSGMKMQNRDPGRQIVVEVMTKFFRIYKVPASDYARVVKKALIKFRSDWQYLPSDWQYLNAKNKKGFVGFNSEDFFGHPIKKINIIRK